MIYRINPSLLSFSRAERLSERKKGEDEKEDGRTFETRLLFSFFLYIRREQTIEDTNSLEKQRVCLGEICNSSASDLKKFTSQRTTLLEEEERYLV